MFLGFRSFEEFLEAEKTGDEGSFEPPESSNFKTRKERKEGQVDCSSKDLEKLLDRDRSFL